MKLNREIPEDASAKTQSGLRRIVSAPAQFPNLGVIQQRNKGTTMDAASPVFRSSEVSRDQMLFSSGYSVVLCKHRILFRRSILGLFE